MSAVSSEQIARARGLMRRVDRVALATLLPAAGDADGSGPAPYASLALAAVDHDLAPVLLLSRLAEHTRAIAADARVSLLFDGTSGLAHALTGERLSVMGRAEKSTEPRLRARYLARHPEAEAYAGFADFSFYRVAVERAHLVAGFGRIDWIGASDLLLPAALADPLPAQEADIVAHMNADHADAVALYAERLLGLPAGGWIMTGIDRHGVDLRHGGTPARLDFEAPVANAGEARRILVDLAREARDRSRS